MLDNFLEYKILISSFFFFCMNKIFIANRRKIQ